MFEGSGTADTTTLVILRVVSGYGDAVGKERKACGFGKWWWFQLRLFESWFQAYYGFISDSLKWFLGTCFIKYFQTDRFSRFSSSGFRALLPSLRKNMSRVTAVL